MQAAKDALVPTHSGERSQWVGVGPSIRARARLALATAFLVATPTLFVGVLRTSGVSEHAAKLAVFESFLRQVAQTRLRIETVKTVLWRFEAQPEVEHERALRSTLDALKTSVTGLVRMAPREIPEESMLALNDLVLRSQSAVFQALRLVQYPQEGAQQAAMARARLIMTTLATDSERIESIAMVNFASLESAAVNAMSTIGRDLLILFLVLLFAVPVFVGFMPGWLVSPLIRLKRLGQRVESGKIRELNVTGNDEISQLARVLKDALMWREELDNKKSAKIFEVRNVLRAVITLVDESVLIIDKNCKINYANQSAAHLFATESHHLEGNNLTDSIYAPSLFADIKKAVEGDVMETAVRETVEFSDGRVQTLLARLTGVRNREGEISRVVLVLFKEANNG